MRGPDIAIQLGSDICGFMVTTLYNIQTLLTNFDNGNINSRKTINYFNKVQKYQTDILEKIQNKSEK
eukprot:CAMPEP_0116889578 /NCGR_PEP_ID=MMETSP0467-20121206/115_1 /TAXON_ID=283647 /ORGANISM="Mesodinium pulex, Strain SPMC105" /LENGTH=66 /DNA_ID=CAMNT_0004556475 /DNA_START=610 /DNA_END=810 /DNA_ORIENTATION=-